MRQPSQPSTPRGVTRVGGRARNLERRAPFGPRIYVGTPGVDDGAGIVDYTKNPWPYRPGDPIGPPPFVNGWTNAFLLDSLGNPGDGFNYRWVPHGIQMDCGGGITGGANNTIFTTLLGVPLPSSSKPYTDALLDGTGVFTAQLLPSGDFLFISLLGIDGGGA